MRLKLSLATLCVALIPVCMQAAEDPTARLLSEAQTRKIGPKDWPQLGGWSQRNNTPDGKGIPEKWNVKTGRKCSAMAVA